MKSKILLLGFVLMGLAASSQGPQAQLGCDTTTFQTDTLKGKMVYLDATDKVVVAQAYAVRTVCRLMYYGINGAPNAPTNQQGIQSIKYYTLGRKEVPEENILKFIVPTK